MRRSFILCKKLRVLKYSIDTSGLGLQWNLQQRTPPIMETSTMWTKGCGPELFPIVLYCDLHIAETSLL